MPTDKRPLKVFLCHAHADRDSVRALYTRLTQDGVDAWLDKAKLLPGQDWELEIRKAVREADVVVVCLSKQFNQAGFRQKEVRLALDTAMEQPEGEIFIIPARLEECDTLESLRKWHWVDLFEDDGYEMLMRALQARAVRISATIDNSLDISIVKVGQVLENQYRVLKVLSIANHSQIVQALHVTTNKIVAIKFFYLSQHNDRTIETLRENLKREARILSQLHHPNSAKILQVIENPVGIVLEWIDGKSLFDFLDDHKTFSVSEVIRIGTTIADILSYAHAHGIVHRDIKPSNIILSFFNEPILVDFDIARIFELETISFKKDGKSYYVGTLRYSAPEQFTNPGSVPAAADIFSLGMVLYELLTFESPFAFGTLPTNYEHNLLPVPEQRNIPDKLYEILCQMLSQDPKQRPSASELRRALEFLQQ